MCRQGASVIQTAVLGAMPGPSLAAYVVWVPILPGDAAGPDEATVGLVPDERAAHFWDAGRLLPERTAPVLRLPAGIPAWDVYLAYPPGALWGDNLPRPAFWHHQLPGVTAAPRLAGAVFGAGLKSLLGSTREGDGG